MRLQASTWSPGPLVPPGNAPPRGRVTIFSDKSRRRLRVLANEILWPRRRLAFITLTYPRHFEADPTAWKRDLDNWRRRFAHRWGPPLAIWAMEFQRRGAPHFHLAIVQPEGATIDELRAWSAATWYEIAGHGDERHLRQHEKAEHCKPARGPRGLVGYLQQELGKKTEQKALPAWLTETEGVGRWWGIWGNLRRGILDERITPREFAALSRLMHAQLRRRGARVRWQWRWGHVMLFDRGRRQWGLFYELMHYLAIIRGRCRQRGSLIAMEVRASSQLRIGPPVTVAA